MKNFNRAQVLIFSASFSRFQSQQTRNLKKFENYRKMPRQCVIKGCRSNDVTSQNPPMFAFPTQENRFELWLSVIREASGNEEVEVTTADSVCIKHFEEKDVCRYAQTYDDNFMKSSNQKSKVCLTKDAVPSLQLINEDDTSSEPNSIDPVEVQDMKPKTKRGSSGLANLQKARLRKKLRRERMKSLLLKRASQKSQTGDKSPAPSAKFEDSVAPLTASVVPATDYFLGNRKASQEERLIVALRLNSLVKRLHDGPKLCKNPPESSADTSLFPYLNTIRYIEGLKDCEKVPIDWTSGEAYHFIKVAGSILD